THRKSSVTAVPAPPSVTVLTSEASASDRERSRPANPRSRIVVARSAVVCFVNATDAPPTRRWISYGSNTSTKPPQSLASKPTTRSSCSCVALKLTPSDHSVRGYVVVSAACCIAISNAAAGTIAGTASTGSNVARYPSARTASTANDGAAAIRISTRSSDASQPPATSTTTGATHATAS